MIDTTTCPECGDISEVQDRHVIDSTDGPVEHAKIMCIRRHWFLLPVSALMAGRESASHATVAMAPAAVAMAPPAAQVPTHQRR